MFVEPSNSCAKPTQKDLDDIILVLQIIPRNRAINFLFRFFFLHSRAYNYIIFLYIENNFSLCKKLIIINDLHIVPTGGGEGVVVSDNTSD